MKQVLTIILPKSKEIEHIRQNCVKNAQHIQPHITLVYPIINIDHAELKEHIIQSLKNEQPFEITLKGLQKSAKEYYLYVLVDQGRDVVTRLPQKLNSGILCNVTNPDMPHYVPHMTLGIFETQADLEKAMAQIAQGDISFQTTIRNIQLLAKHDDRILAKEDFELEPSTGQPVKRYL